jgi:hypothetical protein
LVGTDMSVYSGKSQSGRENSPRSAAMPAIE